MGRIEIHGAKPSKKYVRMFVLLFSISYTSARGSMYLIAKSIVMPQAIASFSTSETFIFQNKYIRQSYYKRSVFRPTPYKVAWVLRGSLL